MRQIVPILCLPWLLLSQTLAHKAAEAAPATANENREIETLQRQSNALNREIEAQRERNRETAARLNELAEKIEQLRELNRRIDQQLGLPEAKESPQPENTR